MPRKIYRKLTKEQRERNVIFCSTLSRHQFETDQDTIHEVLRGDKDTDERIERLKNDRFFNDSHFKYNIIRT